MSGSMEEIFGPVISKYTRAQAIEDGFLADVSEVAREAGITFPVAITTAVWEEFIVPDPRSVPFGQSVQGRLWDTVWMLRCAITMPGLRVQGSTESCVLFKVIYIMKERQRRTITLKAECGPGDSGEPVITIMKTDES